MSNISQKQKYISEVIQEQYKIWNNEFIVFDAATCSGKTYFTLRVLAPYAESNGKRLLYLCNRKQLRKDIQIMVKQLGLNNVNVLSYQTLQRLILDGKEPVGYSYIIFDEIHYLTSDSFNGYTDITYKFLMKQKNNVCILMSATAKPFFQMLLHKGKVKKKYYYVIDKDYSYVQKVYFYKAKALTTLIDDIIENSPEDKIIMFCNSEKRLIEMNGIYKDRADYYCSEENNNSKLQEICNPDCILHHSDNYITFDKQILFTTKVLDNGIDLKDTAIKHIFTEIFDLDSMIQSLGRKRPLDLETDICDFYIKEYTPQGITCFENNVRLQLEPVELLKQDEQKFNETYGGDKNRKKLKSNKIFYMKFGKKGNANNDIRTNGEIRINNMMYAKYDLDSQSISQMLAIGYIPVVCIWLGNVLASKIDIIEIEPHKRDLFLEYLESIKGNFLFQDERKELKEEFEKVGLRDRTMGINTLNGKLKDMGYLYIIKSGRDRRRTLDDGTENQNRDKKYWFIEKIQ